MDEIIETGLNWDHDTHEITISTRKRTIVSKLKKLGLVPTRDEGPHGYTNFKTNDKTLTVGFRCKKQGKATPKQLAALEKARGLGGCDTGRYTEGLMEVLSSYQGPPLITALEILIATAEENAKVMAANEIAATVCEGLHEGPGKGLKCRQCYEAESSFAYTEAAEADIALVKSLKKGGEDDD